MTRITSFAVTLLVCMSAKPAVAEIDDKTRDVMRTFINEAGPLYNQGKYEEARAKWMMALGIVKIPTVALWAGRANDKLGKLVAASELFESAIAMQPNELWMGDAQQKAQDEARAELQALKARIPTLKLETVGGDGTQPDLAIDGARLDTEAFAAPRPLDPGEHFVVAAQSGRKVSETVALKEGENKVVPLRFGPPAIIETPKGVTTHEPPALPPEQTPPVRSSGSAINIAAWSALGVGAAGLAFGTVAGIVTIAKHSSLTDAGCTRTECRDDSLQSKVDSYNTWRHVSTASYIVGAVGVAAGVTLFMVKPKTEGAPTVGFVVAPNAIGAAGRFW
jgi:hypothetical protein